MAGRVFDLFRGPDIDAVYEGLGEMDSGSFAGLKALYSDARKRAGVAAGIGAYLYTSLEAVVLPIGPNAKQVQAIRRQGKSDLLVLSADTEQWLRHGYQTRMSTDAVRRDLGEIAAVADPTIVILNPGAGDAVQAAKAGVLEVADIVAVNKDANAPIFEFADLGIVGDLNKILPKLTAALKARRDG